MGGHANPDEETTDWRAVCGRTACTVRRAGRVRALSDPYHTEDFSGPLREVFDGAMAFVLRNLRKLQAGQGVNSVGIPEIPPSVFEELLVNSLVHRDYLISAPIRLFIFDNRIDIISPGHLPNHLTVAKIRTGNSIIRNPILVSYIAKGLLPYKGLGSGIKRALNDWPEIDFTDDREGCLFTATVHRKEASVLEESSEKSSEKRLSLVKIEATLSAREIALKLGITPRAVEKQIARLRKDGRLKRVGPAKGGRWDVIEA